MKPKTLKVKVISREECLIKEIIKLQIKIVLKSYKVN